MLVVSSATRRSRRQEVLRQNHLRAPSRTVRTVTALANPVETVAGSDRPSVRCGTVQVLAEVFKHGGMFRRDCGKVVERCVGSGSETCGCDVVSENAAIHNLGEEGGLRNHLAH